MSWRQLLKTSCILIVLVASLQILRYIAIHLVILRHTHVQGTGHSGRDGMYSTAILFLRVGEQQPREETTEQLKQVIVETAVHAGNNCWCLSSPLKLFECPSTLHNCCDVCQQSVAMRHVWIYGRPEFATWRDENKHHQLLVLKKCQQLHAELCPYRESLCQEDTDRSGQDITLLLGACFHMPSKIQSSSKLL